VAIGNVGLAARIEKEASTTKQIKPFLGRYFYLCTSLVLAALVILRFSRTANATLFHANPPRPLLLWIHGAAFSTWMVFFIAQTALVRARKVSVHRLLGWFGAGLAAVMVVLGFTIAVVMARFDTVVLKQKGADTFLSVPFADMIIFGSCIAMTIYWRKSTPAESIQSGGRGSPRRSGDGDCATLRQITSLFFRPRSERLRARLVLPAQPVDATPSNALLRQCSPGRTHLFDCTRSRPSLGSVLADLR
jgi:hypothetical protein